MTLGLLAALGTLLAWSGGTLAFLVASRAIPPALLNRSRLLLAAIATATIAMVVGGFGPLALIADPSTMQWIWLGLSGVVGLTIGDFLGFSGLRILGARRQSVIFTIAPGAAAIGGWLMLDETLTPVGILGMIVSIGGVMWAMNNAEERDEVHREGFGSFTAGVLLAAGGAVCQGYGLVLAKIGMTSAGADVTAVHATFMRMIVGFGLTYVMDVMRRDRIRPLREAFSSGSGTRAMFLATLLGPVTGVSLSLYAAKEIGVATAQTIFSMTPFVIMGLAAIRQHEKLRPQAILGAVVAVIGVVVLVWWG